MRVLAVSSVDGTVGMAAMGATIGICATSFSCTANCRENIKTCSKRLSLIQPSDNFVFLLFFKGEQITYDFSCHFIPFTEKKRFFLAVSVKVGLQKKTENQFKQQYEIKMENCSESIVQSKVRLMSILIDYKWCDVSCVLHYPKQTCLFWSQLYFCESYIFSKTRKE